MSNFSFGGSHAVSVYTTREEIVYGIFENELDSLSEHNTLSMVCFSVGSLFINKVIDDWGLNFNQYYHWALLTIIPYLLGSFFLWKKRGLTKKIKEKSKPIGQLNV